MRALCTMYSLLSHWRIVSRCCTKSPREKSTQLRLGSLRR